MDQRTAQHIPAEIFRAYDIRGEIGSTLNAAIAHDIGLAIGSECLDQDCNEIVIARDGRLSGLELATALAAGIMHAGVNIVHIGAAPTPVLYFATHHTSATCGVMVTGSHNPANYNGFKIVIKGKAISGAAVYDLYKRITKQRLHSGCGVERSENISEKYQTAVLQNIELQRPLKIVIDCGNGIAGAVAPELFKRLGCEVIELFTEVDGNFPNHHPDPSVPENLTDLIKAVQTNAADLGLAFDGDGDRLGIIDNKGEIIWPDRLMMFLAQELLAKNPGATVLYDVKCSKHLKTTIENHHGKPIMCKTGHSFVKQQLLATGALLAGEMSGHIFYADRWFGFDDAIYAGARLLEALASTTKDLHSIMRSFPNSVNTPEIKIAIPDDRKFAFLDEFIRTAAFPLAEICTLDGLRADFAEGWGLVRCSNTTPNLILRFEADNYANLAQIQAQFKVQLNAVDNGLVIPF